ncbi:hypothetical protein, partial [Mycobacterium sp. NPDC050853]|uniref:hypothetical protein n=1 Tax=Mycobacterium sp. NPDC050853 TaxID=3155160 RepID=UPI003405D501
RAANGEQNPPNYSTAPAYTGQQSIPNTAPPQQETPNQREPSRPTSTPAPTSTETVTSRATPSTKTQTSTSVPAPLTETVPGHAHKAPPDKSIEELTRQEREWSPTLKREWDQLKKDRWSIEWGEYGKGTFTDTDDQKIVIDPQNFQEGNNKDVVQALAHELGHATHPETRNFTTDGYVDTMLRNEGYATINNIMIQRELESTGGRDIGIAGDQDNKFNGIFDKYFTSVNWDSSEAWDKAGREIGQYYGDHLRPSVAPLKTYRQYYTDGSPFPW